MLADGITIGIIIASTFWISLLGSRLARINNIAKTRRELIDTMTEDAEIRDAALTRAYRKIHSLETDIEHGDTWKYH